MTLYLVRHGQSGENDSSSRSDDSELTDTGREQAKRTGAWFAGLGISEPGGEPLRSGAGRRIMTPTGESSPALIYSSPAKRTLETAAQLAAACNAPMHVDPDLCEYGMLYNDPGFTGNEILSAYPHAQLPEDFPRDRGWASDHRGEQKERFIRRTEATIERIRRLHPVGDKPVAIVTHAHFSGFLLGRMMSIPVDALTKNRIRLYNCGIACVEFSEKYKVLYYSNTTGHLGDLLTM